MADSNSDFSSAFKEATAAKAAKAEPEGGAASQAEDIVGASGDETHADDGAAAPAPPAPAPAPKPADEAPTLEGLQRQLQEAQHRERSSAGRISSVTTENNRLNGLVNELKAKIDALAATQAAAPVPSPAPSPASKDVLDEAPDLNAAVAKRLDQAVAPLKKAVDDAVKLIGAVDEKATRVTQVVEPISRSETQRQHEATWAALDERFTQKWRDDIRGDGFKGWISQQPEEIKSLYLAANTPDKSAKVLNLYYAENGGLPARPAPTPSAPAAPAAAPAADPNQERLRLSAGIPSRGAARPVGLDANDFSGNFKAAFRKMRSEQPNL